MKVNLKDYIESGVLESYLMGELSDQEMRKVDHLADQHPALREELEKIRKSITGYASATDKQPPAEILHKVLDTIEDDAKSTSKEIPLTPNVSTPKVRRPYTFYVAASLLLLISITFNLIFFLQLKDSRKQIRTLTEERTLLAEQFETATVKLDRAETRITHFLNDDNINVRMDGQQISPQSYAHVFWNKKTNAIFISVDNLPEPPHGHQYQLWAIKPGQAPVDAGIFDHNTKVQQLKVIKGDVIAFAVTLEKEGGTQQATVEKTYVKGFL